MNSEVREFMQWCSIKSVSLINRYLRDCGKHCCEKGGACFRALSAGQTAREEPGVESDGRPALPPGGAAPAVQRVLL